MKLTILGTAAAEAWPAPFCDCPACDEARRRGGPNIRMRSGALIDNDLKIDFGPDTVAQTLRLGIRFSGIRTIVFTHQHSDHIVPTELAWASGPFTNTPPPEPIVVYGNAEVGQLIRAAFPGDLKGLNLDLQEPLEALKLVTTAAGDTIMPLPADHVKGALTLRITRKDGKTVFYGHDSGLYPEETLNALAEGPKLDLVIFDCTYGGQESKNRGHMGVDGVIQMAEELKRRGAATPTTKFVATHFSHNGGLMHEELCEKFLPHGILTAYDGFTIYA